LKIFARKKSVKVNQMEETLDTMMSFRMRLTKITEPVSTESIPEPESQEPKSESESESESELQSKDIDCENSDEPISNKSKYDPALTFKEHYLRDHSYISNAHVKAFFYPLCKHTFITGNKQNIISTYSPFPLKVLRYVIYE
jgi:hypothetical protein